MKCVSTAVWDYNNMEYGQVELSEPLYRSQNGPVVNGVVNGPVNGGKADETKQGMQIDYDVITTDLDLR